ncbi:CerR family C-terminal domain-containing protein [Methylogaea oryzae]|uniref:TetR family transcriptional regulator n=1 Tax=Methylogaea oryzae TaxID=1295382 RepID=A0A8D4VSS6_9GAMM|nr:CerR family C-terminal domain-containing protein [Methylogaea oryzae]BBL72624.1 TetR family transcriptional regulator [Methylogaea oryzae]
MTEDSLTDPTRDRLLRAAGQVFAEKGFREATVREICRHAEVNVAAVNYHFRGKEALYGEALAYAYREADARYPLALAEGSAEERLRHYIGNFLRRLLDQSQLGWHGRLIAREITEPTAAIDGFVATTLIPHGILLHDIVAELLGPDTDPSISSRCALSIMGQCLMYRHGRAVIDRACPELIAGPDEIERTAEHIVAFSLAGLRAFS